MATARRDSAINGLHVIRNTLLGAMIYNQSVAFKLRTAAKGSKVHEAEPQRLPSCTFVPLVVYSKTANRVDYWEDPAGFSVRR